MGNVETSMTGVVLVQLRLTVTTDVVAVEITAEGYFAVTAYAQTASLV